jgi:hypothetical protein
MRGVLGLMGLLMTLAIVGFLARQQLKTLQAPVPVVPNPDAMPATSSPVETAVFNAAPRDLSPPSPQIQQQVKQAVDGAMLVRPVREEQ